MITITLPEWLAWVIAFIALVEFIHVCARIILYYLAWKIRKERNRQMGIKKPQGEEPGHRPMATPKPPSRKDLN